MKKTVTSRPHTMLQPGSRIGLPFGFELNRGQADPRVRFLCRRSQTALYLTDNEAIFIPNAAKPASLRMKLRGANPHPQLRGVAAQPGRVNYFCGSDRRQWRTDIPLFARVRCAQVYPGVDLVYYGNGSQLEYDLVVAPGADPSCIALEFTGAQRESIHPNGDLVLSVGDTPIRMHRPVIYQERWGQRQILAGGFQRRGRNSFGFRVAEYDHARPLIIDPEITFSTCLGGSGEDVGNGVAVDSDGNAAYITGYTASTSRFAINGTDTTYNNGTYDAFVAKI
ncbi:MAG TPA: SBBP repeat-containing protein, partial [Armatimonadota bacterium]|nr:SBBP repeat-containing protein [Armatimonadota bacterium]